MIYYKQSKEEEIKGMKKQIKINRLQLILIVISIIVVESIIIYYFSNSINQNIEIAFKAVTNQINIDE